MTNTQKQSFSKIAWRAFIWLSVIAFLFLIILGITLSFSSLRKPPARMALASFLATLWLIFSMPIIVAVKLEEKAVSRFELILGVPLASILVMVVVFMGGVWIFEGIIHAVLTVALGLSFLVILGIIIRKIIKDRRQKYQK